MRHQAPAIHAISSKIPRDAFRKAGEGRQIYHFLSTYSLFGEDIVAFESRAQRIDVLLIADNTGDLRLIQETLRDANAAVHLFVAFDGVDAMAFLKHDTGYKGVPNPEDGRIRHWA